MAMLLNVTEHFLETEGLGTVAAVVSSESRWKGRQSGSRRLGLRILGTGSGDGDDQCGRHGRGSHPAEGWDCGLTTTLLFERKPAPRVKFNSLGGDLLHRVTDL
jgi:hypothetical protein